MSIKKDFTTILRKAGTLICIIMLLSGCAKNDEVPVTANIPLEEDSQAIGESTGVETKVEATEVSSTYDTMKEYEGQLLEKIAKDYEYEIMEGTDSCVITGYSGSGRYIKIPEKLGDEYTVYAINEGVFANKGIVCVVIPDGVVEIRENAFSGNKLTYVYLGESLRFIGRSAFEGNSLSEVELPDKLEVIDKYGFVMNKIEYLECPESLIEIRSEAFQSNEISEISFNSQLKIIGAHAFDGNNLVGDIELPDGLEILGSDAFWNNSLKSITIGSNTEYNGGETMGVQKNEDGKSYDAEGNTYKAKIIRK